MSPERWHQVEHVYYAALREGPQRRDQVLAQTGADEQELRHEVESLLSRSGSEETFLDQPAWMGKATPAEAENLREGTRLGPYRIEVLIGAGGMGEVYRAEDTRLHRPAAIKLI